MQNGGKSSDPKLVGSDSDSSDEQERIGGGINDLRSGNNVALHNLDNNGSIIASQGTESGGDSSDSTDSGTSGLAEIANQSIGNLINSTNVESQTNSSSNL